MYLLVISRRRPEKCEFGHEETRTMFRKAGLRAGAGESKPKVAKQAN